MKRLSDRGARAIAIGLVVLTAVLAGGVALWRVLRPRQPHVEVDYARYPVRGLDISAHNGAPDFDSIAAAGIDFVYLKASEGLTLNDPAFLRNYLAARRAGLKVGAYHFFRFDCDGAMQSVNFLKAIGDLKPDLPLAIDVEEWRNAPGETTSIVRERLEVLVALLRAQGYQVMIYTNKQGHARFVRDGFKAHDVPEIWICSFTNPPLGHEKWRLWQHSHLGRLPGIRGNVDLNTFNGNRRQWSAWLDSCRRTQ